MGPPTIRERGYVGLGDKELWLKWEACLLEKEIHDWERMKAILERGTPEFRAAAMNYLVDLELKAAREGYKQALAADERRRMDVIFSAQEEWKGKVRWFDEALSAFIMAEERYLAASCAAEEARKEVVAAHREIEARARVLMFLRSWFRRAYGQWQGWAWPGAERGRGMSRYDTSDGVATVKAEVAAAVRRRHQDTAARPAEPEAPTRRRDNAGPGLFEKK